MRKAVKVLTWTLGMAFAAVLIIDGKVSDPDKIPYHALEGGILGFVLGCLFLRKGSGSSKDL